MEKCGMQRKGARPGGIPGPPGRLISVLFLSSLIGISGQSWADYCSGATNPINSEMLVSDDVVACHVTIPLEIALTVTVEDVSILSLSGYQVSWTRPLTIQQSTVLPITGLSSEVHQAVLGTFGWNSDYGVLAHRSR